MDNKNQSNHIINNDLTRYHNQRFQTGSESLKLEAGDMPPPEIVTSTRHLRGGGNLYPRYKNQAGRNLMVYNFTNDKNLVYYQLEMLANNRINGLLESEVIRINGEIRLQYDITSLVPLKKLFERRKLSRKNFLYLTKQITELLGIMEQYLLDSGGIIFDSTYIFADPQSLELGFAYLPTQDKPQNIDSLKNFLLDAIINDIQFIDEPSDNFIQRLLEILKGPEFIASSLKKYYDEMNSVKSIPITNKRIEHVLHKKETERKLPTRTEVTQKAAETVKVKKFSYPAKSYIVLYSVIGTLILFCAVLVITGILSPSNPDSLLSLFGFILIGGAVTYLVYSKLFTPDKKIERVIDKKNDKKERIKGTEYVNKVFSVPVPGGSAAYKEAAVFKESPIYKESAPATIEETFNHSKQKSIPDMPVYQARQFNCDSKNTQTQDKTVILNGGNLMLPYLKRMLGNSTETIVIKNFPFMMGRLDGQVDYCINNPAVGKLHAEISKTTEGYFISDLNSRNGTIINGERIEPIKEVTIKNGDRITLGNEEFIFYSRDTNSIN